MAKQKCKRCQVTRWVLTAMILVIVLAVTFLGIETNKIVFPGENSSTSKKLDE